MSKTILISQKKHWLGGIDYKAAFFDGNIKKYETLIQKEDIRSVRNAGPKGWERATIIKDWVKAKKINNLNTKF